MTTLRQEILFRGSENLSRRTWPWYGHPYEVTQETLPALLPSSRLDVEGLQLFEVITKAFLLHKGLDIWVRLPKSQEKMKINSFTILKAFQSLEISHLVSHNSLYTQNNNQMRISETPNMEGMAEQSCMKGAIDIG